MGAIKTYKESRFSTVILDSGEPVMLSVAKESIAIFKMQQGGLMPGPKIGNWPPNDLEDFLAKFGKTAEGISPFRATVEFLASFPDIHTLQEYIIQPSQLVPNFTLPNNIRLPKDIDPEDIFKKLLVSSEPIVIKDGREMDKFLAKLTIKPFISCLVIVAVSIVQSIRFGYKDRYLFLIVGAILSVVAMFAYFMQVEKKSGHKVKPGLFPMLIAIGGFVPYIFGSYLLFYEGLWKLKYLLDGFSIGNFFVSVFYVIFGYSILWGIYRVSEFGGAVNRGNILIK